MRALAWTVLISALLPFLPGIPYQVAMRGLYQISKKNHLRIGGQFYLTFNDLRWDFSFHYRLLKGATLFSDADYRQREFLTRARTWALATWFAVGVAILALATFGLASVMSGQ